MPEMKSRDPQAGDIVAIQSGNRFLLCGQKAAWMINTILKRKPPFAYRYTDYTHVGILIESRLNGKLFLQVAEMNGLFNGFRMLRQITSNRQKVMVLDCPVSRKKLIDVVIADLERYRHYDKLDAIGVWFNSAFSAKNTDHDRDDVLCSTWVFEKLMQAGFKPPKSLSAMPSPAHIAALFKEKCLI